MGIMSVVVLPTSIHIPSPMDLAISRAAAIQFVAAKLIGSPIAFSAGTHLSFVPRHISWMPGKVSMKASSTKRTPSALVVKQSESSAVMVIAMAVLEREMSEARYSSTVDSLSGSLHISKVISLELKRAKSPEMEAHLLCTPPMSQPTITSYVFIMINPPR